MSKRVLLLVLAGTVIIMIVFLMRSRLSEQPVAASAPVQAARIVIAKRDLTVGNFVQGAQDLDWGNAPDVAPPVSPDASSPGQAVPAPGAAAAPKEAYLYEGSVKLTDFNGAVVRRTLHAGDPVPQNALMKSGEGGFMSAVLEAGMRAVSIGVNATSGNAGFVSPGDRIDLIVTHHLKMPDGNITRDYVVSETFVRDVRVVAVDQMIDNPENKAILAKTVTVEVTPHQAEEISVAMDMGKISIALRSLSRDAKSGTPDNARTSTSDSDISQMLAREKPAEPASAPVPVPAMPEKHEPPPRVQVIHGDKIENMDFSQGSR